MSQLSRKISNEITEN